METKEFVYPELYKNFLAKGDPLAFDNDLAWAIRFLNQRGKKVESIESFYQGTNYLIGADHAVWAQLHANEVLVARVRLASNGATGGANNSFLRIFDYGGIGIQQFAGFAGMGMSSAVAFDTGKKSIITNITYTANGVTTSTNSNLMIEVFGYKLFLNG